MASRGSLFPMVPSPCTDCYSYSVNIYHNNILYNSVLYSMNNCTDVYIYHETIRHLILYNTPIIVDTIAPRDSI